MKRILIQDATLVNEGKKLIGSVVIENELITKILPKGTSIEGDFDLIIPAQGKYLIPGVIDDHVHFRDPGVTQKGDITTESRAAAAGGVTSIMDMPNTSPQTTSLEALEEKLNIMATKSVVNYSCYFGATNQNVDLLPHLDRHSVCGVKVFMGASTGNMLVDRIKSLEDIFRNSKLLIATHCENQDLIRNNTNHYKELLNEDSDLPLSYHPIIRSAEACYQSTALAVKLAKQFDARLHVLHLSTAKELDLFSNEQPLTEKKITAEACIGHLMFSDKDYEKYGTRIKCNPSIKTLDDQEALRKGVMDNRIDIIATDHAPHLISDKEGGALKAASGTPTIQYSLVNMLSLVDQNIFTIEKVVEKMCHAPAELFRIEKRGYLREGYFADLVLLSPNAPWTVETKDIESLCKWSPFEGQSFNWKVEKTLINGAIAYENQKINSSVRGQKLRFK